MNPDTNLLTVAREEGLMALLGGIMRHIDAIATGGFGTEPLHLLMIPGRLVQAARNRTFLHQLASEFEALRSRGSIKPRYEHSEEGKAALQQLLAALEDPPVDEAKFEALKNIFIAAASTGTPNGVPPLILLEVARTLTSGELVVLGNAFRIARDKPEMSRQVGDTARSWIVVMTNESGLGATGLVEHYSDKLAEKKLIGQRTLADRSGMHVGDNFGLTDFGMRLCEFLDRGAELSRGLKNAV